MVSIQSSQVAWAAVSLLVSVLCQHQSAISAERNSEGTVQSIPRLTEVERPNTNAKDLFAQSRALNAALEARSLAFRRDRYGWTLVLLGWSCLNCSACKLTSR